MADSKKNFKFENGIKELEQIVETLENPDTGLDESINKFKQGIDILNKCNKKLAEAELEIKNLTDNNN
jgi:exodeoxyribonuclease VII small subunit